MQNEEENQADLWTLQHKEEPQKDVGSLAPDDWIFLLQEMEHR